MEFSPPGKSVVTPDLARSLSYFDQIMGVQLLKDFCSFTTALYNIWDNLVLILAFKIVFQELYTERSIFFFQASGQD